MDEGAKKLQQVISKLQKRKSDKSSELPYGIRIDVFNKDLIQISRLRSGATKDIEFYFVIRIVKHGTKEKWWPVEYRDQDNKAINCETKFNGKAIVNLQKQLSLVELANTWAGSIIAQESSTMTNSRTL